MPYDPSLSAAIERQNREEYQESVGAEHERERLVEALSKPMKTLDDFIAEAKSELESAKRAKIPNVFSHDVHELSRRLKGLRKLKKQFLSALEG